MQAGLEGWHSHVTNKMSSCCQEQGEQQSWARKERKGGGQHVSKPSSHISRPATQRHPSP